TGTGANRSETETASVQHRSELDRRRMALCASYLVATSASERSSASRFLRKYTWRRIIATVSPCSSVISTSNQCRYLSPLAVLERISCQVSSETCISAVILPLTGLMIWADTPPSQDRYSLPSP